MLFAWAQKEEEGAAKIEIDLISFLESLRKSHRTKTPFNFKNYYSTSYPYGTNLGPVIKAVDIGNNTSFNVCMYLHKVLDTEQNNLISTEQYEEKTYNRKISSTKSEPYCTIYWNYKNRNLNGLELAVPEEQGTVFKDYVTGKDLPYWEETITQLTTSLKEALGSNKTIVTAKKGNNNATTSFNKESLSYIIDPSELLKKEEKEYLNRKLAWLEYKTNTQYYVLIDEVKSLITEADKEELITKVWNNAGLPTSNAMLILIPIYKEYAENKPISLLKEGKTFPIFKQTTDLPNDLNELFIKQAVDGATIKDLAYNLFVSLPKPYEKHNYHFFRDGQIVYEYTPKQIVRNKTKMVDYVFSSVPRPDLEEGDYGTWTYEANQKVMWWNNSNLKEEYVDKYGEAYVYEKAREWKKTHYIIYKDMFPDLGNVPELAIIDDITERTEIISEEEYQEWIDQQWKKLGFTTDILFTITTGGSYAFGKTALQVGTKVTVGMVVDVVLQAGIQSLAAESFEDAIKNIDYGQVAYSGVEALIPGWQTQALLSCIREASVESMQRAEFDFQKVSANCLRSILFNILSHRTLKSDSRYFRAMQEAIEKSPGNVAKNLYKLGLDKDAIEWIAAHTGAELSKLIIE